MRTILITALFVAAISPARAHHSVLNFDGKKQVTITGVVTKARFGFPHSKYQLEVTAEDGSIEAWTLTTEDPRDARQLGFADAIRAIKPGDKLTVIGWPHKFEEREIRGHQLHYPDGRIVMMRRGNYIWPKDILRLDRLFYNPDNIPEEIKDVDAGLPFAAQLIIWIEQADPVARAAWEAAAGRPKLIGIESGSDVEYHGVEDLLVCHTRRDDFINVINVDELSQSQRDDILTGLSYVSEHNRLLSRWWEQERESCG